MIAWSILAAKASGCFESIIISTDDEQIASIGKQWGAEVPFMRPKELASDTTPTMPVLQHAHQEMERLYGREIPSICCIYATAPFLQKAFILSGLKALEADNVDIAFSATSFAYPIQRALILDEEGHVSMLYPQYEASRSQELEECFHDAGQFYWIKRSRLRHSHSAAFFNKGSKAILLPREYVQDIDTLEDWRRAEVMHQALCHTGLTQPTD